MLIGMPPDEPTGPQGNGVIRVVHGVFRVRMDPATGRIDADLVLTLVWPGERAGVWKSDWTYQGIQSPGPVAGRTAWDAFGDLMRSIYDDYASEFVHDHAIMDKTFDELDLRLDIDPAVSAALDLRV